MGTPMVVLSLCGPRELQYERVVAVSLPLSPSKYSEALMQLLSRARMVL